jgi:hypothetical protein
MSEDEREAFNLKIKADAALRMAFEYYKLNRQKLLEQLIEEHQLAKKDGRLNKLIFLLISLTGIALVVNHFIYKNVELSRVQQEKPNNIFVRYIPFLNWENRSDKKVEESKQPKHIVLPSKPIEKEDAPTALEPSIDRNERLSSDEFDRDTAIAIWEKAYFDKRMAYKRMADSLGIDTAAKGANLPALKDKPKKLLVEFWQSPFQYKGYLYYENKIVLYGIEYPSTVYIYKANDTLSLVLPNGIYPLTDQPKFSSF